MTPRDDGGRVSCWPHLGQNFADGAAAKLQVGQAMLSRCPHSPQNWAVWLFSYRHFGHCILLTPWAIQPRPDWPCWARSAYPGARRSPVPAFNMRVPAPCGPAAAGAGHSPHRPVLTHSQCRSLALWLCSARSGPRPVSPFPGWLVCTPESAGCQAKMTGRWRSPQRPARSIPAGPPAPRLPSHAYHRSGNPYSLSVRAYGVRLRGGAEICPHSGDVLVWQGI